jgi:hypothetical protein
MSAGSNLSGLAPLGSRKLPPPHILPETANNEMTDFDLIPDKSSRGQEMLSPLAMKRPQISSLNSPNPALKASFGRNPNRNKALGQGLTPLGANRNLSNDFNADSNDPLMRSLKQKKKLAGLAPIGIAQKNLGDIDQQEAYQSPIKRRIGANRIISPMGAKKNELPMHVMGVSRTNLSSVLRQPKMVAPEALSKT